MRVVDIIRRKRDGFVLTREEIAWLVRGYCAGQIPDYQVSAFLMAVYFRGMANGEMADLTAEMLSSGQVLDLSDIQGKKVDKHSTGGVGDKTSLVIAPLVAAAGVYVPMVSGRSLGHTGGTLDKLESIPGFNSDLSVSQFKQVLKQAKVVLAGQTSEIAPADKKIYALRDVTATIDSIPLIACSIMSKKLAEGIDALVLDVKTGSGAFMKGEDEAEKLASAMVDIGKRMGKEVVALITDMNQPLGDYVGNSLEVIEAVETLKGNGPEDLTSLCVELAAYMLLLGGAVRSLDDGREKARSLIRSHAGLHKLKEVVRLQGGDAEALSNYELLPKAKSIDAVPSPGSGYVAAIDAEKIGQAVMLLGAGRERLDSQIDHAVGAKICKKIGDEVKAGEPLCLLYYNDQTKFKIAAKAITSAYTLSSSSVRPQPLIKKVIS